MANLQVASRYAKALLQLAIEQGVVNRIYEDMLLFDKVCTENKLLLSTLQNPIILSHKKLAILQALFAHKVHALTLRLLQIATQKNREALLPTIKDCFLAQYNHYQGIKRASITTTFPLSSDLIAYFKTLVQSIAPCKKVVLVQHIKQAILGGFILQVDDKQLDESLITKLNWLKKRCITSGY